MDREIGQIIKKLRVEKGLSQEDLALEAIIPQQAVSQIEKGIMSPKWDRVCDVLEVLGYEIQIVKADK